MADQQLVDDLVTASRILSHLGIVDGFGHVSVRCAGRPDRFLMSRSMPPGLVTAVDILELDLDGEPITPNGPRPHLERYIHSEIYRRRADVNAVVHSHSPSVIPFTVTPVPLKPVYHMSGFLGEGAPVFEIRETAGRCSDMLIRDRELGQALAETLGVGAVALMRGHGFVTVGADVKLAVLYAVYTELGARVQTTALALGPVNFLTPEEATNASATNDGGVSKAWDLWKAQVSGDLP